TAPVVAAIVAPVVSTPVVVPAIVSPAAAVSTAASALITAVVAAIASAGFGSCLLRGVLGPCLGTTRAIALGGARCHVRHFAEFLSPAAIAGIGELDDRLIGEHGLVEHPEGS